MCICLIWFLFDLHMNSEQSFANAVNKEISWHINWHSLNIVSSSSRLANCTTDDVWHQQGADEVSSPVEHGGLADHLCPLSERPAPRSDQDAKEPKSTVAVQGLEWTDIRDGHFTWTICALWWVWGKTYCIVYLENKSTLAYCRYTVQLILILCTGLFVLVLWT